jgi:WD40 repeat protein
MVPGAHPFEELEAALLRVAVNPPSSLLDQLESDERGLIRAGARVLPDGNQELVLLIDQFEEVFSLVTDSEVRVRFLQTLLAVAQEEQSRVRLILTLRADFFDQPLLYPEFADVIKAGLVTVTPLAGDELEEAIVAPGRKVGASFETGLVGQIASDVLGQPGALPLLQYALTELFERQDGGVLTRAVYRDLGGVTGALGMRAEEIYTSLDPAGEEAARQVFLRLVTLGEGTGDTRRRVARSELDQLTAGADAVAAVVDAFGGHRLLSFDRDPATRRPTVEVAHESLLREWPRLREWIDLGRDDVRTQRRIATATADWSDADGDESFLITGARLERIEAWAGSTSIALTEEESAFVAASITRRNELEALDAERAAREATLERRAARRMRVLVAVLGVGLFVAAGLSFFAFNQRSEAQAQARVATAQGLAAAAIADLDSDPELSLLLALEGAEVSQSAGEAVIPEIEDALHRSLQAQRSLLTLPEASAGALSPDGTRLVTGGPANTAVIRDADSGVVLFALEGHSAPVVQSLFSPDGAQVATASEDGSIRIWDSGTGLFLRRLDAHRSLVRGITYAADGSLLASFGGDNQARVWDPRTGALVDSFSALGQIGGVAFSPDGEQWAVASILGATVLDVHSSERTTVTERPTCGVDYGPDGNGLALGTEQGVVELWDLSAVEPATPIQTFAGHTDIVCGLAISADGSMIASGGDEGLVKIWDVETGDEILTLAGHSGGVRWVELAPDGGSLLSASRDGTTKRWDITLEGGRELLTADVGGPVGFVDFSPDGSRVMTFSVPFEEDGLGELVTIWDVSEPPVAVPQAVPEFATGPEVTAGFLSQDWTRGVLQRVNGTLLLFDVGQGTPVPELTEVRTLSPPGGFGDIALNRDGSLLADIRVDRVSVIETDSGEEIFSAAPEFEPGSAGNIGFFDAEGTHLLVGSPVGGVKVWNIETGDLVVDGSHSGSPAIRSLVAANGLLATGTSDSTIQFWDMTSGDRIGSPLVHGGDITAMALSPDRKTLASASTDGTVKLWDTTSGDEKLTLGGHRGLVTHVDFHPDGDKLVTSGVDGTIRVWTLDVDELIDLARRRATRELTGDECRQYVPGDSCGAD